MRGASFLFPYGNATPGVIPRTLPSNGFSPAPLFAHGGGHHLRTPTNRHAAVPSLSLRRMDQNSKVVWSMLAGVLVFMVGEGAGFAESFYWAIVTASSIGYGDVVPTTAPMRWFTVFYRYVRGFTLSPYFPGGGAGTRLVFSLATACRFFSFSARLLVTATTAVPHDGEAPNVLQVATRSMFEDTEAWPRLFCLFFRLSAAGKSTYYYRGTGQPIALAQ